MSTSTSTSPEAEDHASFLAEVRAMAVAPGLSLPIVRAVCESLHRATAEPEEVSYPQALGNGSVVDPLPEGQHSFILGAGRVPEVDESISRMGNRLQRALNHGAKS